MPLDPPDPLDPTLRHERYIVEPTTLAYAGADHFTPEQLEAAKVTGWFVMTKDELLEEWRRRASGDR